MGQQKQGLRVEANCPRTPFPGAQSPIRRGFAPAVGKCPDRVPMMGGYPDLRDRATYLLGLRVGAPDAAPAADLWVRQRVAGVAEG